MDDVAVAEGECQVSGILDCDFEEGTCGFSLQTTGYYNWTRRVGKATSSLTGPAVDHTVITSTLIIVVGLVLNLLYYLYL